MFFALFLELEFFSMWNLPSKLFIWKVFYNYFEFKDMLMLMDVLSFMGVMWRTSVLQIQITDIADTNKAYNWRISLKLTESIRKW